MTDCPPLSEIIMAAFANNGKITFHDDTIIAHIGNEKFMYSRPDFLTMDRLLSVFQPKNDNPVPVSEAAPVPLDEAAMDG